MSNKSKEKKKLENKIENKKFCVLGSVLAKAEALEGKGQQLTIASLRQIIREVREEK